MDEFHPLIARWFQQTLGTPTAAQRRGWEAIRRGDHTLIAAPTGSGKTLAAFLIALDDLVRDAVAGELPDEVRTVYVSPLKALSADIHKNLAEPRAALKRLAHEAGLTPPRVTAAVRTGDTPSSERAAMLRVPPHILVTTPESLYLLLTAARSRELLRTVRTVIVDEIHAVIGTRRGAHLALSLERLEGVAEHPPVRIGLSATQHPIGEVARFLVGAGYVDAAGHARCAIVDEGHHRTRDLAVEIPGSPLEAVMAHEVWEEYYDRLADLVRQHRTTLVFANTRRMVERVSRHLGERLGAEAVAAHHGSLSKERRLDAEHRLKHGQLRVLVATASLELGIDIGHVDLVCQIGSPRRIATLLQRVGRAGHTLDGTPKGRLFPTSRDDLVECAALLRAVRRGALDRLVPYDEPLDVLAQQIVAETSCPPSPSAAGSHPARSEDDLYALVRRAWPYRALKRPDFDAVIAMLADGFATQRGRRAALVHRDEVNRRLVARRAARLTALTSGGAIPDNADYRVLLDPDELLVGTLNEDFAIESLAGDVFQLGNTSWRILRVGSGVVHVQDARGAPPTIPFWLGEAPSRSVELSEGVGELRGDLQERLDDRPAAARWLMDQTGVSDGAARQIVDYFADAQAALGALPTQQTLVLERFFDEAGGMQLVLHAPFGSRVNRAWGLALRKRFCRQFNFELQAAATDDALLLSLGPQHSFPLADVFRYLHPATARDVLVQALLDAPVFQTRWRWNTTIALAVPRSRQGRKVPAQLQRMQADDLLAAAFPDAAACLENIPGDREIPDHPLVRQAVRDCLEEAMDLPRLEQILERVHDGTIRCLARDTPEPSQLAHEILNARPYAFLDDAPLEERRTQAVLTRRTREPDAQDRLSALDPEAIARVRDEAWPDPRDVEELHDALTTAGFLTADEIARTAEAGWLRQLADAGRAAPVSASTLAQPIWTAAERLPEVRAVLGESAVAVPALSPPAGRAAVVWTRETALVELLRGRLAALGPVTARDLAGTLGLSSDAVDAALHALEAEGVVLRGAFVPGATLEEWCDRRLLARIHRYTLNRLRAEIEPVSPAVFMRFLFAWQHVASAHQAIGVEGLRSVLRQLDGYEIAAGAWERHVLPARVQGYEPGMLDRLCFAGEIGWGRLSAPGRSALSPVRATPVALFLREHEAAWRTLAARGGESDGVSADGAPETALVRDALQRRGASFVHEIAGTAGLTADQVHRSLASLVAAGAIASDGFGGLRGMLARRSGGSPDGSRSRRPAGYDLAGGRWSLASNPDDAAPRTRDDVVERQARALLGRYGVVFRRLLAREGNAAPWRELTTALRRLEARGEIRGGRFVSGMTGEQFALPEAVTALREVRRTPPSADLLAISAADPLNLAGIVTAGGRIAAAAGTRIVYRDGVPLAALEGDYVVPLTEYEPADAAAVTRALTGRAAAPAVTAGFVGR